MAMQAFQHLVHEHAPMVPKWQLNTISHLLNPALYTPSTSMHNGTQATSACHTPAASQASHHAPRMTWHSLAL
eukprot:1156039-Pelagomonas_calceolata.AAC.12